MLWGLLLPMPDPQVWELDVGLRTLTPVGESLDTVTFQSVGYSPSKYAVAYIAQSPLLPS